MSSHRRTISRALLGAAVALLGAAPAAWGTAAVLSPLNAGSVSSPAASHLISYDGDWAMDIAGTGDVYARLSSSSSISLRVERVSAACRDGGGGTVVRVRAYLDGAPVALLVYSHLAGVAVSVGQTIGNGARLGHAATGLARSDSCWTGPHVHFEARNDRGYACYVPLGGGAGVGASTTIGRIGPVGGAARRYPCPAGSAGANPLGTFDQATSPQAGGVRVRGWAFDPDARTTALAMHVYVGGAAGEAGAEGHAFTANASRPDVGRAYPGVGDGHGLDVTFETGKRGAQRVCLYAINIHGGGNVGLGCKTVTIADPNPAGTFDQLTSPAAGRLRVRGWAFDRSEPLRALAMHVYVGGAVGEAGAEGHAFTANASRPDVGRAYPGVGDGHGLDVTFETGKRGAQRVCLYAIDVGYGANVSLGCKTVTIAAPSPLDALRPSSPPVAPPASAAPAPVDGGPTVTWSARARRPGRRLTIVASGLAGDALVALTWRRSRGRTIRRVVRLKDGRARVRAPRRPGRYLLVARVDGEQVGAGRVVIRRSGS